MLGGLGRSDNQGKLEREREYFWPGLTYPDVCEKYILGTAVDQFGLCRN